ncbi:MAG TPA: hypothetical protein IAB07_05195 [Candidatus Caccalectryoclostridium excrementigallinarum]|uniref:Polysaccharide biosynthesis protein n=1 Tax=Candidatus Caccalectryoclostridium excrementigallinarum TaxID=2840710 RepID=A0A9D1SK44_9FIRM|nr:hypothetical protein [Candidatus Caccalectryoclostridium excrementigallinarum]
MTANVSRTKKSLRNTVFGMGGLFCSLVVSFATKSVFVRLLGAEYNGVNGLFSNILQVLNLAELGFATSIAYALYKPLKNDDERATAALMNYFARIYRIIAIIVAAAGCCCIPFLQYLIAEDISELSFSINELRGYFAMYLASTVCSYLLAYKRTIITADQNNYLVTNVDNICNIMLNVTQIVLLLIYKNYYAYLTIMIAKTIINNLILHLIASKKYPYLRTYRKERLPKTAKSAIFKNVQAAFLHRIGGVIAYNTTSIVISAFVSLIDAGKYSNYIMIITGVSNFVNILFNSVTASIGNLCVDESEDRQYSVFKKIQYVALFAAVFSYICYICLFNPFVEIWVGSDMVMSMWVVFAISLNAMVGYFRRAVTAFKDAKGMFRNDWYKPLLEAGVGIGLAIGLSYVWGTFGVVLGYTLSTIFIAIPIENVVLFKQGIHKSVIRQILTLVVAALFAFAVGALGYYINTFIPSGIGWFILRFIFVVVFAAGAFIFATCWTPEFKYYKALADRIFKAMLAKIKNLLHRGKKAVPAEGQESRDVVEGGAESVDDSAESLPCAEERESGGDKSEEGK